MVPLHLLIDLQLIIQLWPIITDFPIVLLMHLKSFERPDRSSARHLAIRQQQIGCISQHFVEHHVYVYVDSSFSFSALFELMISEQMPKFAQTWTNCKVLKRFRNRLLIVLLIILKSYQFAVSSVSYKCDPCLKFYLNQTLFKFCFSILLFNSLRQ